MIGGISTITILAHNSDKTHTKSFQNQPVNDALLLLVEVTIA